MPTHVSLPTPLQKACDQAVSCFHEGKTAHAAILKIRQWLELDGWDALVADIGDQMALDLVALAHYRFDDSELRAACGLPDDADLTETDRVKWARECVQQVIEGSDDALLPSVHAVELRSTVGQTAVLGCLIAIRGQAGPECDWQGLWKDKEAFVQSLASKGLYWVTPLMGEFSGEAILARWQFP